MSHNRTLLMALLAASLAGCFGSKEGPPPPPPLPPTRIELHVEASKNINPNAEGRSSPVLLRIYELKGLAGFNAADYFALLEKDQSALGGDLGRKRELMLRPGETQTLILQPEDASGFFAAYAGFRDLQSARWRVSASVMPHTNSIFGLKLEGNQLILTTPNAQKVLPEPSAPANEAPKK